MDKTVSIEISRDRSVEYYVDIQVNVNKIYNHIKSESTAFFMLYAYYEDSTYDTHFNINNLREYLIKLKEYIETDIIFYIVVDIQNKKRFFYNKGKYIEVDYNINTNYDIEMPKLFGDEAYKIINNQPI